MQAFKNLNMKNILINILAFATLLSAVLVITSKNPVISVLFLIFTFVFASVYLILNGLIFIGISYIIIYVGAIAVLFLFIIMMINIRLSDILETGSQYTKNFPLALVIGILFLYELFTIMPFTFNNIFGISILLKIIANLNELFLSSNLYFLNSIYITYNPAIVDTTFKNFLQIEAIGQGIYTYGAIWLIIISIILLLAMITPIFISRTNK